MNKELWINGGRKLGLSWSEGFDYQDKFDTMMRLASYRMQLLQNGWRKLDDVIESNNRMDMKLNKI